MRHVLRVFGWMASKIGSVLMLLGISRVVSDDRNLAVVRTGLQEV
jgi:hypothetical protein